MINHIISECSKLAQKEYKIRHNWVGKVIHWELYKKLKFDHTTKPHMHKPESVLENVTHKILWDFQIENGSPNLRQKTRPSVNKKQKTCCVVDFAVSADHRIKTIGNEKRDKYSDLARELRKLWVKKVKVIPIVISVLRTVFRSLEWGLEKLEIGGWIEIIHIYQPLRSGMI